MDHNNPQEIVYALSDSLRDIQVFIETCSEIARADLVYFMCKAEMYMKAISDLCRDIGKSLCDKELVKLSFEKSKAEREFSWIKDHFNRIQTREQNGS